jgi:hypothetical protein
MSRNFWSCFSGVGLDALGATYDDALGHQYEYDSHVVNHKRVTVGDVLVVRDRHLVYGYGVVETIEQRPDMKVMQRCPECRSADIKLRATREPAYRCNDCREEFDIPISEPKGIIKYVAAYGSWWFPFASPTSVRSLERVYAGKDQQNAIRHLDPVEAQALLRFHASLESHLHLELLTDTDEIVGGHVEVLVRARVGQQLFRDRLFERFGSTCAVTGSQPDEVLDAAHLYSFAARPDHRRDGGLLLRADIHRMFDRLLLTFDPTTWSTHVAPQLLDRYEGLRLFEARPMAVPEWARPERSLLEEHFSAAHARWSDRSGIRSSRPR